MLRRDGEQALRFEDSRSQHGAQYAYPPILSLLVSEPYQTQTELNRCLQELTRVKVSHLTEEALHAQDEALLASLPKPKPKPAPAPRHDVAKQKDKPAVPQLSPEEELFRDKWTRLLDMIKRGRLDTFKSF